MDVDESTHKALTSSSATSEKVKEKEHKIATPNSGSKHALYTQRTLVVPLHPSTSTIVGIIGEGVTGSEKIHRASSIPMCYRHGLNAHTRQKGVPVEHEVTSQVATALGVEELTKSILYKNLTVTWIVRCNGVMPSSQVTATPLFKSMPFSSLRKEKIMALDDASRDTVVHILD